MNLCFSKCEGVGGLIDVDGISYELLPIKENVCVLRKVNFNDFQYGTCGNQFSAENQGIVFPQCGQSNCPSSLSVKIVVAITPEYLNWSSNIHNGNSFLMTLYHALSTQSFKNALDNSNLSFIDVEIIDHNISNFTHSNPPNMETDLNNFIPISSSLRAQYGADDAVLMTERDYSGINGLAECAAQNNLDCSSAVVRASKAVEPIWIFAHEVGHLFGARHERFDDFQNQWKDYCGHGFQLSEPPSIDRRTVMHQLGGGETQPPLNAKRVLHFSNPDVFYQENGQSYVTGTTDYENNALVIKNILCNPVGASLQRIDNPTSDREQIFTIITPDNNRILISSDKVSNSLEIVRIFDLNGRLIFEDNGAGQQEFTINTDGWLSGMYIINIQFNNQLFNRKIIKK